MACPVALSTVFEAFSERQFRLEETSCICKAFTCRMCYCCANDLHEKNIFHTADGA